MEFKIKIGDNYFVGFNETEKNGALVGGSYQLICGQVIVDNKGISLDAISVKGKVDSIIEQMRFEDIPKENIMLEVVRWKMKPYT